MYFERVSRRYFEDGLIFIVNIALLNSGFTSIVPVFLILWITELFPEICIALSKLLLPLPLTFELPLKILLNLSTAPFAEIPTCPLFELVPLFIPNELDEISVFPIAPPFSYFFPFPYSFGFLIIFGAFTFTTEPSIIEGWPAA